MCHEARRICEVNQSLHIDGDTVRVWFCWEDGCQWVSVGSAIMSGNKADAMRRGNLILVHANEVRKDGRRVTLSEISAIAMAVNEGLEDSRPSFLLN